MKRICWLYLAILLATAPSWGAGVIIIHEPDFWWPQPPRPTPRPIAPPPRAWAPLEVTFTRIHARVQDQVAATTVDQEFSNPNNRPLEGTFLFPVPKGAQLDKFTMEINGKPVEAELLGAEKARGIYEDIVRRLRDPALLEYAGRDLFKVRVFPIEPNSKKRITIAYTQLLKADGGMTSLQFPLSTEKFSAKALKNLAIKVEIEAGRPLKSIYSPSHKVEVKRHGDNRATVGYEVSEITPDLDFELFFSEEKADVGLSLLSHKAAGEDGYFLLLASPGELKEKQALPKDVAFVLDTSGSMAGAKLEQAKKALLFGVENLNDSDRFEILRFSTEVEPLFEKLAEASRENRARAEKFIKDLKPIGGTAIDDALKKAIGLRPGTAGQARPYMIVFLTDGRPTVGNTEENQIVEQALKMAGDQTRIFSFGLGTDVNTRLLDRITEGTRAVSQYVLPEEDLELKLSSFFSKIKEPVLTSPKLKFPDGVRVSKLYPTFLPDLFKGEQLVAVGRYANPGEGEILLEGTVNGNRRVFEFKATLPDQAAGHSFIPRLWATRRVGYLLDEIRLRGESKELKDEVVELARRYGVVTPYTAYLILEDEQRRGVAQDSRTFPELARNQRARSESKALYMGVNREVSGDRAVAGARSFEMLKAAEAPQDALVRSGADTFRVAPATATPELAQRATQARRLSDSHGGGSVSGPAISGGSLSAPEATAKDLAAEFARQGRFVNGRTFYQQGKTWIDSEVQKQAGGKRTRLVFGSDEYFTFIQQHPQALAWLALGQNLQFVLDGMLYEIVEPDPAKP